MEKIVNNFWVRLLIVALIVTAGVLYALPDETRSAIAAQAVLVAGYFSPAVVVGALAGFLMMSREVWLWTTAGLGAASAYLLYSF